MLSTNRKDWEIQIMALHIRRDALVHHTTELAGFCQYSAVVIQIFLTYCVFTNLYRAPDGLETMPDIEESYQMWLDVRASQKAKTSAIEARLGPSSGIKFQLERSWAGKYVFSIMYSVFFLLMLSSTHSI
jgi:hypothetical protein